VPEGLQLEQLNLIWPVFHLLQNLRLTIEAPLSRADRLTDSTVLPNAVAKTSSNSASPRSTLGGIVRRQLVSGNDGCPVFKLYLDYLIDQELITT
jgi:hypothetical protein